MTKRWTREQVLGLASSYQGACVLAAAVDLGVFDTLGRAPTTADALAERLAADGRGLRMLLDALVGMELLARDGRQYRVPAEVAGLLTDTGPQSVRPMALHQGNCLRRWAQLPEVVKSGRPAVRRPSLRGEAADTAAFIGAMHVISGPVADQVVACLGSIGFREVLDIGGASGTWTMALLRAVPQATATIFDLPDVIPMARERMDAAGFGGRIAFVAGDFYRDELPRGADFAWLSAIAHQNSREQNVALFAKIHRALADGGTLVIRDVVMDECHSRPVAGAMFAVNMLVATEGGGTYTLSEYREDLTAAGFAGVELVHRDEWMNSLVRAVKP